MQKVFVKTKIPPFGAYSTALSTGDLLFTAGQCSSDEGGNAIHGTIEEETRRTMENLKHICERAGTTLDNMVKVTVFLEDVADFDGFERVYKTYFKDAPPVRSTVIVKLLGEMKVEIEAIAVVPKK